MTAPAYSMTINGQRQAAAATLDVINPATEEVVGVVPDCSREQLDDAVSAARQAFASWRSTPIDERRAALLTIAEVLSANAEELTKILTAEQGKPLAASRFEIDTAAWWIQQVAAMEYPVVTSDAMPGQRSVTRRVPLGVVGGIVPWNFPILLAVWKIGPAILAGNSIVLKPSPNTPIATLRLGELLLDRLPAGVLNIVSGGNALGPWMSAHPGIDKLSFTGSTATGRKVMESASANLKRLTLELGGNDAAIVLPDADVSKIAEPLFWAAFSNSGQVCVAAKRIFVHSSIYDELAAAMRTVADSVSIGAGTDEGVVLGPVQNRAQFEHVRGLIDDSRSAGHNFIVGGVVEDRPGFFVPVTIVDNPPDSSRVVQEEAFGPIVPLLRYADVDEAVRRANASDYGLAGSVWGSDVQAAADVASRLETGTVWINSAQGLTPFAVFAGHKQSGLGAENGEDGLLEFTAPQTVHLPN